MGWRGAVRRLPLAGAAAVGAAVGHSIAYLIVAPQGRTRAALLAGTGHGYWSTAVAAEIVIGLLVVVSMIAGRFRDGLRRRPRGGRYAVGVAGAAAVPAADHHLHGPGGPGADGQRPSGQPGRQ
jgi:hypothetical protein